MNPFRNQRSVLFLPFSYQPQFHEGVAQYAGSHGWHLNADTIRTGKLPYGWQGDGIITLLTQDLIITRLVLQYNVPVVDLAMIQPDLPIPRVAKDNYKIGRMGAMHFLEQGWQHYVYFSREVNNVSRLRLEGFRDTLQEHGRSCTELILNPMDEGQSEQWDLIRQWLVREIGQLPKPLAIMAFCDFDAAVIMDACLAGHFAVPEEVGILGVDDIEVVCLTQPVPLSSVRSEAAAVGYQAAELLDRLMNGAPPPREPILVAPAGIAGRQSSNRRVIHNPRLGKAIDLMNEQIDRPISMEQVADAIGMTRQGLHKIFRQEMRQTPAGFLRSARIKRARELLLTTPLSIGAISRQCGMPVLSTFIRQFLAETGMRPHQWRRQMQNQGPVPDHDAKRVFPASSAAGNG